MYSHGWDLASMFLLSSVLCCSRSRQQEMEARLIEEEVAKRVEEMVAKRVEQELEKRKDDIEAEVLRRVEEAKRIMEAAMLEEMEQKKQQELEAQQAKEVRDGSTYFNTITNLCCQHPCFMRDRLTPLSPKAPTLG